MRTIVINVVSDAICPWCYIGKRRMERAISTFRARFPQTSFEVRWHPFFLDSTLSKEGESKLDRYVAKFGEARVTQMLPQMQATGFAEGISFNFGGLIADTTLAHQIAEAARGEGGAPLQNAVIESMFRYYFEEQGNLGDVEGISAAAARGGMALERAREACVRGPTPSVAEEAASWRRRFNITGVPFFVVDNKVSIAGAQDAAAFLHAFEVVSREED